MQQVLLRVLQEKEIQPVGGKARKVSVRIISATNKNLADLCREGKFRWDLFYRLAVAELELPGLQERGSSEIAELINYFIRRKKSELRKESLLVLEPEVARFLQNYSWPGNVRELENLIETLYVFQGDRVKFDSLPSRFLERSEGKSLKWVDVEREHIK
jgi:transcriptional regulator with PAS, ATPase and Fis domain